MARSLGAAADRIWLRDRGQLLGEFDAANGYHRVAEYLYKGGVDRPYAVIVGATTPTDIHYIEWNVAGNVIGTHEDSTVTMTVNYDDFGAPSVGGSGVSRLLWKGAQYDEYSGLYYMRTRWYFPKLGRFLSEDAAGFAGSINPYTFADGDPISGRDPSGLWSGADGYGTSALCGIYCRWLGGVVHSPDPFPGADLTTNIFATKNPGESEQDPVDEREATVGGWLGIAASVAEVKGEDMAIGDNFRMYFRHAETGKIFRANGVVRASTVEELGSTAGRAVIIGSLAYDVYRSSTHPEEKPWAETGRDLVVGGVAEYLGGPPGALFGAADFLATRYGGGWPQVLLGGKHDCSFALGKGLPCH